MSENGQLSITEFLEARIAEDKHAAQAWAEKLTDDPPIPAALLGGIVNPARVLAECAAKRAIIEQHPRVVWNECYGDVDYACGTCQHKLRAPEYPCPTLWSLADVYADHPNYDPELAS